MGDYISREAAKQVLDWQLTGDAAGIACKLMDSVPAADAVNVSALLALRDELYENGQITMGGLAKLNRLMLDAKDKASAMAAVVRCRDCVYAQRAKWSKKGYRICPASHMEIVDDDFCSYGERKEQK